MSYIIATDTTANLSRDIIDQYGILVLPLTWHIGDSEFCIPDISAFDADGFYEALARKTPVRTSLINSQRFVDAFTPVMEDGNDIIFISLAGGISGTFSACTVAAELLAERFPERRLITVDSITAGLGEGLLVMQAARLRESGLSIDETAATISESRYSLHSEFTVDDLMYLKRGGRLNLLTAVLGSVMLIKPLLSSGVEGRILTTGKMRGRKAAINAIARRLVDGVIDPESQTVAINHGNCIDDAKELAAFIDAQCHPKEILIDYFEPVSAAHVGPGAMAVFFFGADRRPANASAV